MRSIPQSISTATVNLFFGSKRYLQVFCCFCSPTSGAFYGAAVKFSCSKVTEQKTFAWPRVGVALGKDWLTHRPIKSRYICSSITFWHAFFTTYHIHLFTVGKNIRLKPLEFLKFFEFYSSLVYPTLSRALLSMVEAWLRVGPRKYRVLVLFTMSFSSGLWAWLGTNCSSTWYKVFKGFKVLLLLRLVREHRVYPYWILSVRVWLQSRFIGFFSVYLVTYGLT